MKSNHSGIWCSLIWEYPNNETAMCGDISLLPLEPVVQEPLLPLPGQLFYIEFNFVSWHCQSEIQRHAWQGVGAKPSSFLEVALCRWVLGWLPGTRHRLMNQRGALVPSSSSGIKLKKRHKHPWELLQTIHAHPSLPVGISGCLRIKKKWVCFQSRIWRISLHRVWVDSRDLIQLVTCSGQAGL